MNLLVTSLAPEINITFTPYHLIFAENFGFPAFLYTSRA